MPSTVAEWSGPPDRPRTGRTPTGPGCARRSAGGRRRGSPPTARRMRRTDGPPVAHPGPRRWPPCGRSRSRRWPGRGRRDVSRTPCRRSWRTLHRRRPVAQTLLAGGDGHRAGRGLGRGLRRGPRALLAAGAMAVGRGEQRLGELEKDGAAAAAAGERGGHAGNLAVSGPGPSLPATVKEPRPGDRSSSDNLIGRAGHRDTSETLASIRRPPPGPVTGRRPTCGLVRWCGSSRRPRGRGRVGRLAPLRR